MPHPFAEEARRYARLIEDLLPDSPAAPQSEGGPVLWVERGVVFPMALAHRTAEEIAPVVEAAVARVDPTMLAEVAVLDAAGHRRPHYRPLFVYCWLQAYRLMYETLPRLTFGQWEEALRPWCELLEAELPDAQAGASNGAHSATSAWSALALHTAGRLFVRDAWTDLAADAFGRLIRQQQDSGAFIAASSSDHPESLWHHELITLHALASYAVQTEDRVAATAVARHTQFVQAEMQPDHATSQPWGLFAFIWNADTRPLADQVLHAVRVQHPKGAQGISLMLLADALYCLRLFNAPAAG